MHLPTLTTIVSDPPHSHFPISLQKRIKSYFKANLSSIRLFFLCVLLYLPGIWWGLPHVTHESIPHGWETDTVSGLATLSELHNLVVEGKSNWYVAYPIFHYLLLGALYAPYLAFLLLTGGMVRPQAVFPYGFADPVTSIAVLALIARLLSIIMAAGTVVSIYVVAKTTWNRMVAVCAAASFALCIPLTYYVRTGTLDVPVLFWTALGLVPLSKCVVETLTVGRGIALGALAGIATATKDQGYAAWPFALLTIIYFYQTDLPRTVSLFDRRRWVPPSSIFLAGAIVYSFASGLVFWPHRFAAHVQFILNSERTFFGGSIAHLNLLRPISVEGYGHLLLDIADCALEAVGPVMIALAVLGTLLTWRSRFTRLLVMMVLGHVLLTIIPIRHMQYRYILLPCLIVSILAVQPVTRMWHTRSNTRYVAVGLFIVALSWPALMSIELVYQMLYDARYQASNWFMEHATSGERLAYFGSPDQLPYLPAGVEPVQMVGAGPPEVTLNDERVRFIVVIPEYSSRSTGRVTSFTDWGLERSRFMPYTVYQQLQAGSLGYRKVAVFKTAPLFWNRPVKFLPTVNPPVQIFERAAPFSKAS